MLTVLVAVLAVGYVAVGALLYAVQPGLVYLPDVGRDLGTTPAAIGLAYEDVHLEVEPGVRVHGWYVPHPAPRGAALVLHGNAGSIGLRTGWIAMFHRLGYASLTIDYRGYGRSSGTPTEEGTYRDAESAWRHLVAARGHAAGDVVVVGESLGGAVAAWLAARVRPRALLLHSAFTSVPDLAAEFYPAYPVRWMSRFSYDTRARLARVRAPVLIAHSRGDEIVPFDHALRLFAAAPEPRRLLELEGGHNDAFVFGRAEWIDALAAFLDEVAAQPGRAGEGGGQASPSSPAT